MKKLTEYYNLNHSEKNFLFSRLEDYYISKSDGLERISKELTQWEIDAQERLIKDLITFIKSSYPNNLSEEELFNLILKSQD